MTTSALLQVLVHATLGALPPPGGGKTPSSTIHCDAADWFRDHDKDILAAARHLVEHGAPSSATSFLTTAWTLVPPDMDGKWCDELREHGVALSATAPKTPELAGLFRRSASVYYLRGDYRHAEVEGMAELAVWQALDNPDQHVAALDSLARTFLARDRLHRVMDCAGRRLQVHIDHDHQHGIAADLQHLGHLMLLADRPDTAVDYLERARDKFDSLPDVTVQQHVRVRMLLALALSREGKGAGARRELSQALRLAVDLDDHTAQQIRELLSAPAGDPLPWPPGLHDVDFGDAQPGWPGADEPCDAIGV